MKRGTARTPRLAGAVPLVLFVCLAAAWGVFLAERHLKGAATPLDRLEAIAQDWRYGLRGPKPPPDQVLVVAIDDRTIERFGGFPLARGPLAETIDKLTALGAAAIAINVLLLSDQEPGEDARLTEALAAAPSVIATAGVFASGSGLNVASAGGGERTGTQGALAGDVEPVAWGSDIPAAEAMLWPRDRFGAVSLVGAVNLSIDPGGTPRHVPILLASGDAVVPSLALAAAALSAGGAVEVSDGAVDLAGMRVPLDLGQHLALDYYGGTGHLDRVTMLDVLDGVATADVVAGRTVILGTTAAGASNTFATPFDPAMPSVEVMATAIGNFATGGGLDRSVTVRRIDAASAVVLPVLAILTLAWRRTAVAYSLVVAAFGAWAVVTLIAFEQGVWLSAVLPLAATLPPVAGYVAFSIWRERKTATVAGRARDALARLQSPALARLVANDPDFLREPATRNAAVLFFDVAGFTTLSEQLGPEGTRAFQNALMAAADRAVIPLGGETMTFLGDGAMIVFGLPEPSADDAKNACRALLELKAEVKTMLTDWNRPGVPELDARYGLNFGPLVLSRIGTDRQSTVTVSGDTINVAARLMEIAKESGTTVAIAESVFEALPASDPRLETAVPVCRDVPVRGRSAPLKVRLSV